MPKCSFHIAWRPMVPSDSSFLNSWYGIFNLKTTLFSSERCLHKSCMSVTLFLSSAFRQAPIKTKVTWKQKTKYYFHDFSFLPNKNGLKEMVHTLSQTDSGTNCLNWYIARNCNGWFFSGLNCPTETIFIIPLASVSALGRGIALRSSTSHGGYTLCVKRGRLHNSFIWSSVHEEFTITTSAHRPTRPYNWKREGKNN